MAGIPGAGGGGHGARCVRACARGGSALHSPPRKRRPNDLILVVNAFRRSVGSSRRGAAAGSTWDASPGVRLAGIDGAGAEAAQGGGDMGR